MTDTMDKAVIPEVEGLTFEDRTHTYRLDGRVLPSVTQIMAPLRAIEYEGIGETVLHRAADKGTAVHNAIENWIKFEIKDIPSENEGYFDAFMKWWQQYRPEVVGSEIRVCNRLMQYAGTIDLVAYINGELTLVDYKSTYTLSDMLCAVQIEAYSKALESMGVKVDKKCVLHLKRDGSFGYKYYESRDAKYWRVFSALKTVFDYAASHNKKISSRESE